MTVKDREAAYRAIPFVAASFVILVLTVVWYVMEGSRVVGLDPNDPTKLRGGNGNYTLNTRTGRVVGSTKGREMLVYGGGSNAPSSTTIHDQFFLKDPQRGEKEYQVKDWDLAMRDGHVLSAVWAIREGKESGSYLLFRNHTTNTDRLDEDLLRKILKPPNWPGILMVFGIVLGLFYSFLSLLLLLPIVAFISLRSLIIRARRGKFNEDEIARLITALDAKARKVE